MIVTFYSDVVSKELQKRDINHNSLEIIPNGVNRLILTDYCNVVVRIARFDSGESMLTQAETELAWGVLYAKYKIPCAKPILTSSLKLNDTLIATVWEYRKGVQYSGENYNTVARALVKLHSTPILEGDMAIGSTNLFHVSKQMIKSCPSYTNDYLTLVNTAESRYNSIMQDLPKVLTHGDPHFGNILINSTRYFFIDLQDVGFRPGLHDWVIVYSTLKHDKENQNNFSSTYNSLEGLTERNIKILQGVRSVRTLIVKHSSGRYKHINFQENIKKLRKILEET